MTSQSLILKVVYDFVMKNAIPSMWCIGLIKTRKRQLTITVFTLSIEFIIAEVPELCNILSTRYFHFIGNNTMPHPEALIHNLPNYSATLKFRLNVKRKEQARTVMALVPPYFFISPPLDFSFFIIIIMLQQLHGYLFFFLYRD